MAVSTMSKAVLRAQSFMLRRGWMGPLGDFIMSLTVTGRKTGRSYATPVGYIRDGDTFIALNPSGRGNWYLNLLENPRVMLGVNGEVFEADAQPITDSDEIAEVFELYKQSLTPDVFRRTFFVEIDTSEEELIAARDKPKYVRFQRISS